MVAMAVDVMHMMAFEAMQSLSMPLAGLPGMYVLQRMWQMPVMKVMVALSLYWLPSLV